MKLSQMKYDSYIIIEIHKSFSGFEIFNFFFVIAENNKVITSSMQEKTR